MNGVELAEKLRALRAKRADPDDAQTIPRDQLDAAQAPKRCSKCKRVQPAGDFPTTSCRGNLIVRAQCRNCMRIYYAERQRIQKLKRAMVP